MTVFLAHGVAEDKMKRQKKKETLDLSYVPCPRVMQFPINTKQKENVLD